MTYTLNRKKVLGLCPLTSQASCEQQGGTNLTLSHLMRKHTGLGVSTPHLYSSFASQSLTTVPELARAMRKSSFDTSLKGARVLASCLRKAGFSLSSSSPMWSFSLDLTCRWRQHNRTPGHAVKFTPSTRPITRSRREGHALNRAQQAKEGAFLTEIRN